MCSVISPHHNRYPNRPYIQTDTTCAVSFHPTTIDIPTDLTYRPIQHVQCHFTPTTIDIPTDLTYRPIKHVQCHFTPTTISKQTLHTDRYNMCRVISPQNNRYPSRPYIQMVAGCTLIVNKSN